MKRPFVHDQHIVPEWHLRSFVDGDGWLWRYKRNQLPRRRRPKGECWEHDFYEYDVNGHRTDNRCEEWLSRIENDAAPLLVPILNQQRLNGRDMVVWASYVASLFLRTQKVRYQLSAAMVQKFGEQSRSPEFLRDLQCDLLRQGEFVYADDLRSLVERFRNNMDSSPSFHHVSALPNHTVSLATALGAKAWHILEAPSEKFFVISDCPVTTVEIGPNGVAPGPGFAKDTAAVILPLTPQRLFVTSSPKIAWKYVGTAQSVDSTNLLTVRFAKERVYAHMNSAEIKALVDSEINRITFGKDAFVPRLSIRA